MNFQPHQLLAESTIDLKCKAKVIVRLEILIRLKWHLTSLTMKILILKERRGKSTKTNFTNGFAQKS